MGEPMTVSEAGRKGGNARAKKLTKERRIEIAKQGYHASPLSTKHAKQTSHVETYKQPTEDNT